MKILYINNYHYIHGGSETVYFNTAELFKEHGHDVMFFSLKRADNNASEYSNYFPDAIDIKTHGIFNKFKGAISYFYNKEAAANLEKLIKIEKPDIAHLHIFWGGLSPSILKVLKDYNIPIVHSVHEYRIVCPAYTFKNGNNEVCEKCGGGNFWHCALNRCSKGSFALSSIMTAEMYYRNMYYHPAKYIDAFIYVSKFCRDIHLKYDERLKKCRNWAIYNFCCSNVLANMVEGLDTYTSYYLFYGRLSYEKGISTLIEAFALCPNLKLKIVGTGPEEKALKDRCHERSLMNIEFLGYKKGTELYDLVKKAKFVCVPSEWYENNPMTVIESYSLYTPVVGAKIGGITEIIQDGKTGYLFDSGSVKDLVEKLEVASGMDKEEYSKMKLQAWNFSKLNFDRELHYKTLLSIYETVLKSK